MPAFVEGHGDRGSTGSTTNGTNGIQENEHGPMEKHFYNVVVRRNRSSFIVSASSVEAALEAVNTELQRRNLPAVVPSDCVISHAIVLQGD